MARFLGIPLDLGSERIGVDMGPNALRYRKIAQKLALVGVELVDEGDIKLPLPERSEIGDPRLKYLKEIIAASEIAAKCVAEKMRPDEPFIAIGGDHSISLGTVSGAAHALKGDIGLIWIDAHPDMHTHETTITGNIHGMPLAALMGFGHPALVNVFQKNRKVNPQNVLLIGAKDIDPAEEDLIQREQIATYRIMDVLSHGLAPLFERISTLQKQVSAVWVSVDLDAVDKDFAPGVGMPNMGGLTYREISAIAQFIGKNCKVIGMDMVEYNPVNDVDHKTSDLIIELTAKLLGKEYSWYSTQYLAEHGI